MKSTAGRHTTSHCSSHRLLASCHIARSGKGIEYAECHLYAAASAAAILAARRSNGIEQLHRHEVQRDRVLAIILGRG